MGLGGVAIAALPSVVHLQLTFSDRLGGGIFVVNIFFHTFAGISYQDDSIDVTIDTFE